MNVFERAAAIKPFEVVANASRTMPARFNISPGMITARRLTLSEIGPAMGRLRSMQAA